MAERLSRAAWVAAGLEALARDGDAGLKADVLAKRLGVSRGSFYWHFADLEAFHAAVIEKWQDAAVDAVLRLLNDADDALRLRRLIGIALRADPSLEIGMRAWAASSKAAEAAVAAVDARRLAHLERMLEASGVTAKASEARARVVYWTYLGGALSRSRARDEVLMRVIDELADFATRGERA